MIPSGLPQDLISLISSGLPQDLISLVVTALTAYPVLWRSPTGGASPLSLKLDVTLDSHTRGMLLTWPSGTEATAAPVDADEPFAASFSTRGGTAPSLDQLQPAEVHLAHVNLSAFEQSVSALLRMR